MYASQSHDTTDIVKLLLERKDLDLDSKDNDGKTAEDFASENNNDEVVKIIREQRSKRMGGGWTKLDFEDEEEHSTTSDDNENNSETEHIELSTESSKVIQGEDNEDLENESLKSQLIENLRERLEKELILQDERKQKYELEVAKLEQNKEHQVEILQEQINAVEEKFHDLKKSLKEDFLTANNKSETLKTKLRNAIDNIDMERLLNQSSSCSDLECPVCLEEMRPPTRIWQCGSGHPVCDTCIRSPRVTCCPTCRQKIVGRNVLAEKLAKSFYGN